MGLLGGQGGAVVGRVGRGLGRVGRGLGRVGTRRDAEQCFIPAHAAAQRSAAGRSSTWHGAARFSSVKLLIRAAPAAHPPAARAVAHRGHSKRPEHGPPAALLRRHGAGGGGGRLAPQERPQRVRQVGGVRAHLRQGGLSVLRVAGLAGSRAGCREAGARCLPCPGRSDVRALLLPAPLLAGRLTSRCNNSMTMPPLLPPPACPSPFIRLL